MTANQPTAAVPGPKALPIIGNLAAMRGNNDVRRVLHLRETYGDLVHLKIGAEDIYLVMSPDDAEHVLQMNNHNYIKGTFLEKLTEVAGNGLFTSEGEFWRKQRRLMQPAFHRNLIAGFGDMMVAETDKVLARWADVADKGGTVELLHEMVGLTLTIVAKALFSTEMAEGDMDTVRATLGPILETTSRRQRNPLHFLEKLPTEVNRTFDESVAQINALIHRIIDSRRGQTAKANDLLQMLLDLKDEETGEGMSDQQLRDEVITLFVAGHETTATALSWAFKLLSEQPVARRELRNEIDTVLGDRTPTANDFPNLPYALAVFLETLRMYPPVPMIPRTALGPDTLSGYPIEKDANAIISTYALHHHPLYWENPDGFDPLLFMPDQGKGRHKFAYVPFGLGPRFCIGEPFAKLEATLILARVTQRFDLNLKPGQEIEMRSISTLRPIPGIYVTIQPKG